MKINRLIVSAALLAALLIPNVSAQLRVVTSTSQIADIVRNVGGDRVQLTSLMGPGVDPHLYKATARDVIALRRAELILYNGIHLEGRLAGTFGQIGDKGRQIVAVAEQIPTDLLLKTSNFEGSYDPHVWFDPELWAYVVDATVEALAEADPAGAETFEKLGGEYRAKVEALIPWTKERLERIPASRRVLITSHDAYSYFGRAFDMQVVGVQGISTVAEAGLADVTLMVDFIKKRQIPAIFVESSVAPGTIRRISNDSGAVVGGELFSDALGRPGDIHQSEDGEKFDVGTFIGMFKYNVGTIVSALK